MLILNHYFEGKTFDSLSLEEIKDILNDPNISQLMYDLVCIEIANRMGMNVDINYRIK